MSRYKAYAEYKDSGVEWLGEVPEGWHPLSIKYLAAFVGTGGTPKEELSFTDEEEIPWFTPSDFNNEIILSDSLKYVTKIACLKGDAKIYKGFSVLVIGIGATLGKVAYSQNEFSCNQQINIITPNQRMDGKFMMHALSAQMEQMKQNSNASTIGIMNQERTKLIKVAVPPIKEQQTIASFLDHETAKIDTLIEKQQQLIALLKEKRQAVISHAVTKGLNPNAKMKDSGVEWLGKVPEGWEVSKFGHFAPIITCGIASTPTYVDENEGMPFLSAQNIQNNKLSLHKYNFISHELHTQLTRYRKPEKGDLLVTRVGAGIGDACVVDIDMEFSIYVSLTHIRVSPTIALNKFIMYFFGSDYCHFLNHQGTVTGGGVGNLNVANVLGYQIPLPSLEEQKNIVRYIDSKCEQFEKIIFETEKSIALVKERRTALISAAVTGKIDVRDWQEAAA